MATTAEPVMQFRSHVAGNSVQVHIYPDRIEWRRAGYKPAGGVTAAVLTGGLSLALPGRKDSNMIPIRMIQGVTTHRNGLSWTLVKVASAGDITEFKVSKGQAEEIKATLLRLMQAPTTNAQVAPTAPVSVADELRKLADLHAQGLLSDAEFASQRARLLG
jgi:predicted HTH transcriptional regulator